MAPLKIIARKIYSTICWRLWPGPLKSFISVYISWFRVIKEMSDIHGLAKILRALGTQRFRWCVPGKRNRTAPRGYRGSRFRVLSRRDQPKWSRKTQPDSATTVPWLAFSVPFSCSLEALVLSFYENNFVTEFVIHKLNKYSYMFMYVYHRFNL